MFKRPAESNLEIIEGKDWSLGVTKEFKDLVGKNSDLVPTIIELLDKLPKNTPEGSEVKKNEITLTLVEIRTYCTIYKFELDNKKFFLKYNSYLLHGSEEVKSSAKAAELLTDTPGVRVVNFHLGYHDKKRSFFVAEWQDLKPLRAYLSEHEGEPKREELQTRLHHIIEIMEKNNFVDAYAHNMFYDPTKDEIILFDLQHGRPGK